MQILNTHTFFQGYLELLDVLAFFVEFKISLLYSSLPTISIKPDPDDLDIVRFTNFCTAKLCQT